MPLPKSIKLSAAKSHALVNGLLSAGLVEERHTDGEALWRTDEAKGKLTLVATSAGLKAVGIDGGPVNNGEKSQPRPPRTANKPTTKATKTSVQVSHKEPTAKSSTAPKSATKLALLIAALRAKMGATIEDLMEVTGWQAHSVRGAISGALKKKQQLSVVSAPVEGRGRVYRIAE